jgi:ubiquinone/menaquinone biosynthesis C-methylase UbiE
MKHKNLSLFLILFTAHITLATNWNSNYHKISQMQFSFAQAQLPLLKLLGNERVLDIGCGTGRTTNFFVEQVPNGSILGIDASEDMICFAQKEYNAKDNLRFEVGDATNLQFDQEFDVVYSFFCLQWVNDKQSAINNIARALKPGGRAFLFIPTPSEDFDIGIRCIHTVIEAHPEWKPYTTVPDTEKPHIWIKRAETAGLHIKDMQIIKKATRYASKKEWNEYCYGLGVSSLPEEDKKKFIETVNDLLYTHYGLSDEQAYVRTTNIMSLELIKN